MGKLPGQGGPHIIFSKAPSSLDPSPSSSKPFGKCRGFREPGAGPCSLGYATDDIFFLEGERRRAARTREARVLRLSCLLLQVNLVAPSSTPLA